MAAPLAGFTAVGDSPDPDELLIGEAMVKKVTLDTGVIVKGDLMGRVTSGGKVIKSLAAASDGSEAPFGIAAHDADATSADVELDVYVKGRFNSARVNYGTGHTYASVYDELRDIGIFLEVPVLRYPNT